MNESAEQHDAQDWSDRLIDQGLREVIGGETSPDLSEAILAAADDQLSSPRSEAMSTVPATAIRPIWTRWAVAASVSFLAGAIGATVYHRQMEESGRRVAQDSLDNAQEEIQLRVAGESSGLDQPTIGTSSDINGLGVPGRQAVLRNSVRGEVIAGGSLSAGAAAPASGRDTALTLPKQQEGEELARRAKERGLDRLNSFARSPHPTGADQDYLSNGQAPAAPSPRGFSTDRYRYKAEAIAGRRAEPRYDGTRYARPYNWGLLQGVASDGRAPNENHVLVSEDLEKVSSGTGAPDLFDRGGPITLDALQTEAALRTANQKLGTLTAKLAKSADEVSFDIQEVEAELARVVRVRQQLQRNLQEQKQAGGQGPGEGGDQYTRIHENPFVETIGGQAVSTFSIDVDTASYANVRQFLNSGRLPPPDAVRLEELINYFDYGYAGPHDHPDVDTAEDNAPFAAHMHVSSCPWKPAHQIVRIGVKGRELQEERPLTNLVFLIDVSGSMNHPTKHPLVIEGLKALTRELGENDRVAIVVYASQEGLALPSVSGSNQEQILAALDNLRAGGSTAGGAGIRLAYQVAEDNFIEGGANRVILCTDGDFNVGTTSTAELERLVTNKAKDTGVFLSVCGFGRGNLNDAMMETISNKGNGNYYYVDTIKEAEKIFVKGLTGTLVTIAKDVKIQVEFNPAKVAGYRLLGYENRMLRTQDFNDDKKDAGEIGAGHTVTALYEIVPTGKEVPTPAIDELKYQRTAGLTPEAANSPELLTLKMRYKQPDEDVSTKLEWPLLDGALDADMPASVQADTQFATAVAGFGMLLRNSQYKGDLKLAAVEEIAQAAAKAGDPEGAKAEFLQLVQKAKTLLGD